mgnify:CR=1 FL=1
MFYHIKITLKNNEIYELSTDSYLNLCHRINDDLFSGFPILKLQTIKASLKKNGKINHLKNIIPSIEITTYKKTSFKTNKEYQAELAKCKT